MSGIEHMNSDWRSRLAAALVLYGVSAIPLHAEVVTVTSGDTGVLGIVTSGDATSTHSPDGEAQKVAEAKDATGAYGIEWSFTFDPPDAATHRLRIRAQATNSKRGMDWYEFRLPDGTLLGVVDATTMSDYDFAIPDGAVDGPLTLQVTDTNRDDDRRRANQLWIDYLAVIGGGAPPTELGPPSDLNASSNPSGTISLDWTDNATAETGFELERAHAGAGFTWLATLAANTTVYEDGAVTPGETYGYRVRALGDGGPSGYSNEAIATAGGGGTGLTGPQTDKVIVGYYPSWAIYNARKYYVSHIPFDRVTHIQYAFANVDAATGQVVVGDSFAEETNRKDPETDNGLPAGNLHQLVHYRDIGHDGPAQQHLKLIISVGGWTWSDGFSDVALTPESRWVFAESLKNFVATFDLDGADIDWEFPTGDPADCGEEDNVCRAEDPLNHALLILASRMKLDELGDDQELSVALPADFAKIAKIMPPMVDNARLFDSSGNPLVVMRDPSNPSDETVVGSLTAVDALTRIHVMNYDLAGATWESVTRHHSPLFGYEGPAGDPAMFTPNENLTRFNTHHAMQAYRYIREDYLSPSFDPDEPDADSFIAEIPAHKLTVGLPAYGRGFKSVDPGFYDTYEGLFQFTDDSVRRRVPKGTYDGGKWGNTGSFAYWDILLNHGGDETQPGHNLIAVEPSGGRPYGPYTLEGDLFIGFDDQTSVEDKADYIVDYGFGGVMVWDFPSDLSIVQVEQGVSGAAAAYPSKSLFERLSSRLEARFLEQ